jgi:hypothetical protein
MEFIVFRASYMKAVDKLGVSREYRAPLVHDDFKGTAPDFFHESFKAEISS